MTRTRALVVLSGGMDSVTALAWASKAYSEIDALTANYGQRHSREIEAAEWQAEFFGVDHHDVVDLTSVGALLSGSALTDEIDVPRGHYAEPTMKATVVPNRNAILANIAAGVAVAREHDAIVMGVHAGDHAIYPDCRPEFIETLSAMLAIANYSPIGVDAPFLHFDKLGILRIGHALGVDYSRTWTCYVGGEKSCGTCGSCSERLEAFSLLGRPDPLEYEA